MDQQQDLPPSGEWPRPLSPSQHPSLVHQRDLANFTLSGTLSDISLASSQRTSEFSDSEGKPFDEEVWDFVFDAKDEPQAEPAQEETENSDPARPVESEDIEFGDLELEGFSDDDVRGTTIEPDCYDCWIRRDEAPVREVYPFEENYPQLAPLIRHLHALSNNHRLALLAHIRRADLHARYAQATNAAHQVVNRAEVALNYMRGGAEQLVEASSISAILRDHWGEVMEYTAMVPDYLESFRELPGLGRHGR